MSLKARKERVKEDLKWRDRPTQQQHQQHPKAAQIAQIDGAPIKRRQTLAAQVSKEEPSSPKSRVQILAAQTAQIDDAPKSRVQTLAAQPIDNKPSARRAHSEEQIAKSARRVRWADQSGLALSSFAEHSTESRVDQSIPPNIALSSNLAINASPSTEPNQHRSRFADISALAHQPYAGGFASRNEPPEPTSANATALHSTESLSTAARGLPLPVPPTLRSRFDSEATQGGSAIRKSLNWHPNERDPLLHESQITSAESRGRDSVCSAMTVPAARKPADRSRAAPLHHSRGSAAPMTNPKHFEHIGAIVLREKDASGFSTFDINDDDGPETHLHETILSMPLVDIRKETTDIVVADTRSPRSARTMLRTFNDSGATVTICGGDLERGVARILAQWRHKGTAMSISAGGMDAKASGLLYKSAGCFHLPIVVDDFNMRTGKSMMKTVVIRIWSFPDALPPDMLILGRDARKALGIATYNVRDLKEMVYLTNQSRDFNTIVHDAEEALERLEYRGAGRPGIYAVADNNVIEELSPVYALRTEFEQAQATKTPAILQIYELETIANDRANASSAFELKPTTLTTVHPGNAQRLNEEREAYIVKTEEGDKLLYIIEDARVEELKGSDALTATMMHSTASTGEKYPSVLDSITYGPCYTKEEIEQHKLSLVPIASVFARTDWEVGCVPLDTKFGIIIKDVTKLKAAHCKPHATRASDIAIIKNEADEWVNRGLGHLQRQDDPDDAVKHVSPAMVVHRHVGDSADGRKLMKSRVVADYVALNRNTEPYLYENLTIQELLERLGYGPRGRNYFFNAADMRKWFWQLLMTLAARKCAAIAVPGNSVFIPDRVTQGLANAPVYAHKVASEIFKGIAYAIQDDLNQGCPTPKDALIDATTLLMRAKEFNIKMHPKKMFIGMQVIEGIGKCLTAEGYGPLQRHRTNLLRMPYSGLRNKTDMLVLGGMVKWIERHVPAIRGEFELLSALMLSEAKEPESTNGQGRKLGVKERNRRTILLRTEHSAEIFTSLMDRISSAKILHWPDSRLTSSARFLLVVDASGIQIGMSLLQQKPGLAPFSISQSVKEQDEQLKQYHLIDVAVRKLSKIERRYGATEREALAIHCGVKKFDRFLSLRPFDVVGDCKPLVYIFTLGSATPNKKVLRWRTEICELHLRYVHRPGAKLPLVDYLSRMVTAKQWQSLPDQERFLQRFRQFRREMDMDDAALDDAADVLIASFQVCNEATIYGVSRAPRSRRLKENKGTRPSQDWRRLKGMEATQEFKVADIEPAKVQRAIDREPQIFAVDRVRDEQLTFDPVRGCMQYHHHRGVVRDRRYDFGDAQIRKMRDLFVLNASMERNEREEQEELGLLQMVHARVIHHASNQQETMEAPRWDLEDAAVYARYEMIGATVTRSMRRADTEARKQSSAQPNEKVSALKSNYRVIPESKNRIVNSKQDLMEQMAECQFRAFEHVLRKLYNAEYKMPQPTVDDAFLREKIIKGKLSLNEDGIIVYKKDRVLIPNELRVPLIHHVHFEAVQHHDIDATLEWARKYYYWPRMADDIKAYVLGCPACATQRLRGRLKYEVPKPLKCIISIRPNQKVYTDLHGPIMMDSGDGMKKHWVSVMVDSFDGYLTLDILQGKRAIDVLRSIVFCWFYVLGFPEKLISDRGKEYTARITQYLCYVLGVQKKELMAYSPWSNMAEGPNRKLSENLRIGALAHSALVDDFGVGAVYEGLDGAGEVPDALMYVRSLAFAHNNLPTRKTGYSPNELRFGNGMHGSLLQCALNLKCSKMIDAAEYLDADGLVLYADYLESVKTALTSMLHTAQANVLRNAQKVMRKRNNCKEEDVLLRHDAVTLRENNKFKNKIVASRRLGWIIECVHGDGTFTIKNVLVDGIPDKRVGREKIRRIHRSLWKNPEMALESSAVRMARAEKGAFKLHLEDDE